MILVGTTALVVAAGTLAYYQSHPSPNDGFRLEFAKTGGIAGVNDTLIVRDDGSATLSSKYGVSFNGTVGPVEFSELKQVITTNLDDTAPGTFQARGGVADYFGYQLAVTTDAGTTKLLWVDQWAVNGTFPEGLSVIQGEIQKLTTDLTLRHGYANTNTSQAGGLRMTLMTDKSGYKIGEQVNFGIILENTGSSNVTYTSPTPCTQDVRLTVSNGSTTQDITMNGSLPCIQVLQGRTLQGNTYIVQTGAWDMTFDLGGNRAAASPGRYTISAAFPYATFEKTLASSLVEVSIAA